MHHVRSQNNASDGIVSVQLLQIKMLHPTQLAVLKCTCVRGSSRLAVGETFFVQVTGVATLDALFSKTTVSGNLSGKSTGRWCAVEDDTVLWVRFDASKPMERNRRGIKVLECVDILHSVEDEQENNNDSCSKENGKHEDFYLHDKTERHRMFAKWLVNKYGAEKLATASGVLDVAGGSGELSLALLELGVPAVLLDPKARCSDERIPVVAKALNGDGSDLLDSKDETIRERLEQCSLVAGMHPDQATEAIVDLSERLGVPFALLPCCVMPSLFPHRRQKRHGDPVRSYSSFCQYLLDKAPEGSEYHIDHLPFVGRNKIIFCTR